jgi:hypothetical protein
LLDESEDRRVDRDEGLGTGEGGLRARRRSAPGRPGPAEDHGAGDQGVAHRSAVLVERLQPVQRHAVEARVALRRDDASDDAAEVHAQFHFS